MRRRLNHDDYRNLDTPTFMSGGDSISRLKACEASKGCDGSDQSAIGNLKSLRRFLNVQYNRLQDQLEPKDERQHGEHYCSR